MVGGHAAPCRFGEPCLSVTPGRMTSSRTNAADQGTCYAG